MLDEFGEGYIIDHFLASVKEENKELIYRNYITDMLRFIVHNTAVAGVDGEGRYKVERRFADMITPRKAQEKEKPEPTADDIIAKMKKSIAKLK